MGERLSDNRAAKGWVKPALLILAFVNTCIGVGYVITSWMGLLPMIVESFGWTPNQWGLLAGAIPLGAAIAAIFVGMIADKISPKKMIIAALTFLAVAMVLRGYMASFLFAYVVILASGMATTLIDISNMKIVTLWFDRKTLNKAMGVLFCGGAFGYFIGLNLSHILIKVLGSWELQFIVAGIFLIVWGALWLFLIPEKDAKDNALDKDLGLDTEEKLSIIEAIKMVLKSKQAIVCTIAEMASSSMILCFSSIGPLVFINYWECDAALAGFVISSSSMAGIAGYLIMPAIGDKIGKRKSLTFVAILLSCSMYCLALFTKNATVAVPMIMFAGIMNGWGLVGPRMLMLEHPSIGGRIAGTATGIFVLMSKLTCAAFPSIFAAVYVAMGGTVSDQVTAWVGIWVITCVVALICIALTQDTGMKAKKKTE